MRMIDVRCLDETCQYAFEYLKRTRDGVDDPPAPPPCEICGGPVEPWSPPPRVYGAPPPVIVFQAPDGSMRFPGDANGLSADNYRRQGFTEIAIRGAADMRRFESHMNKAERSRMARQIEQREEARERQEHENRGRLNMAMQSMSRMGREVARVAMAKTDNRPRLRTRDPEFHSEVYSQDRSNRDDSRDERGRRRRD